MDKIADIKSYAHQNRVPIIEDDGLKFLETTIKENNVVNILEIGSAIGYSSIMMALLDQNIIVDTIERNETSYAMAVSNIQDMNLTAQVNIYHADALDFDIDTLPNKYDLIFIDAAKAQYQKFFTKYEVLLKSHGIILVDNINFHGFVDECVSSNRNTRQLAKKIKIFRDWLLENKDYEVTKHDVGDGIMMARKVD